LTVSEVYGVVELAFHRRNFTHDYQGRQNYDYAGLLYPPAPRNGGPIQYTHCDDLLDLVTVPQESRDGHTVDQSMYDYLRLGAAPPLRRQNVSRKVSDRFLAPPMAIPSNFQVVVRNMLSAVLPTIEGGFRLPPCLL
jgi:hypothetical protein